MTQTLKGFALSSKAKVATLSLALAGSFLAGSQAFAAVDPDVASTTETLVLTMKENVTGVITHNISNIVIVGVIIFSLTFVWRLARRFMR